MRGDLATGVTITWRQSSEEFGGTGRGYVGAHGFKGFGKASIIASPLIVIEPRWVSDSMMRGFVMCISVRGLKAGVDSLSLRYKP